MRVLRKIGITALIITGFLYISSVLSMTYFGLYYAIDERSTNRLLGFFLLLIFCGPLALLLCWTFCTTVAEDRKESKREVVSDKTININ